MVTVISNLFYFVESVFYFVSHLTFKDCKSSVLKKDVFESLSISSNTVTRDCRNTDIFLFPSFGAELIAASKPRKVRASCEMTHVAN